MALKFEKIEKSGKTVKALRVENDGPIKGHTDEHESYGMVSLGQTYFGGLGGHTLFGSRVKHNTAISLRVFEASRDRDAYHDHYHQGNQIVEVYLTPAQFTQMLVKMNTTGVPCTITRRIDVDHQIEPPPEYDFDQEQKDDIRDKYADLSKRVKVMESRIEELLKGTVKSADKEEIRHMVLKIAQDVSSNMAYLEECQTKALEERSSEMVAEAEAQVSGIIQAAGIHYINEQKLIASQDDEFIELE